MPQPFQDALRRVGLPALSSAQISKRAADLGDRSEEQAIERETEKWRNGEREETKKLRRRKRKKEEKDKEKLFSLHHKRQRQNKTTQKRRKKLMHERDRNRDRQKEKAWRSKMRR